MADRIQRLFQLFEEKFNKKIDEKTTWGSRTIKELFNQAKSEAILEHLSELEEAQTVKNINRN